ncbi:MAG TPA: DNA-binding protein [Desulfobulbaceae bacterium]|nr:DNA-binding protein [Desulfobulbaceae bacterium]
MEDRWLKINEICDYLNVTRETVYKWTRKRGMPEHRVGRRWMFKHDQVDQWVESGASVDFGEK